MWRRTPAGAWATKTRPSAWDGYLAPYDGGNTEFALKIENGAELPDALTVVTANPAYIQGDYNSEDKKPAAVLADAITILPNAWGDDDLAYSQRILNARVASNTTINAAFLLGNTETFPGAYNGGVENLPRFLERWSGCTFTYRGSLIDLWYSTNATGNWRYRQLALPATGATAARCTRRPAATGSSIWICWIRPRCRRRRRVSIRFACGSGVAAEALRRNRSPRSTASGRA